MGNLQTRCSLGLCPGNNSAEHTHAGAEHWRNRLGEVLVSRTPGRLRTRGRHPAGSQQARPWLGSHLYVELRWRTTRRPRSRAVSGFSCHPAPQQSAAGIGAAEALWPPRPSPLQKGLPTATPGEQHPVTHGVSSAFNSLSTRDGRVSAWTTALAAAAHLGKRFSTGDRDQTEQEPREKGGRHSAGSKRNLEKYFYPSRPCKGRRRYFTHARGHDAI